MSFFKNYNLLSRKSPQTAAILLKQANKNYELHLSSSKYNLLNIRTKKQFYSNKGGEFEANKWSQSLNLINTPLLFIYGIGLGHYYFPLKEWLKLNPMHRIVFLEDDLEIFKYFLSLRTSKEILEDKQVDFHIIPRDKDIFFQKIKKLYTGLPCTVEGVQYYTRNKSSKFHLLKRGLLSNSIDANTLAYEIMHASKDILKNILENLLQLNGSYLASQLFGSFKNIPAIICGAGPSLDQHLDQLSSIRNKSLIISGGSAYRVMTNSKAIPHFGIGVDPNKSHIETIFQSSGFEVPFFYRSRMNSLALKKIQGKKLYINGSTGYKISSWIEKKIDIYSKALDEGNNVINLTLELAKNLGCNPIILVGVDLAYLNKQGYSKSLPPFEMLPSASNNNININRIFKRKNLSGKTVKTHYKWINEAEWISEFAEKNQNLELINTSPIGLNFKGFKNLSLKETSIQFLTTEYDMDSYVNFQIESLDRIRIKEEAIKKHLKEIHLSLKKSIHHLKELIKIPLKEEEPLGPDPKQTLLEEKLRSELATELLLEPYLELVDNIISKDTTLSDQQFSNATLNEKIKSKLVLEFCNDIDKLFQSIIY